jgi:choline dehydrogenase-like flavoprotein
MSHYDVIVAGGGTAGVPAAIMAARNGAKVLVVEKNGHLGGTAVSFIPFLGSLDGNGEKVNHGLYREIIARLEAENACFGYSEGTTWNTPDGYHFSLVPFDPEIYKYVAQCMIEEAGGKILYHTFITDVHVKEGKITAVEIANKSGKQWLEASVFIDCTGDADLVHMADGNFIDKDARQNCSIVMRLERVDLDMFVEDLKKGRSIDGWGEWHTRVIVGKKVEGERPGMIHLAGHFVFGAGKPETTFTAVSLRDGEIFLNASRVPGLNAFDGWDVSKAESIERKQVTALYRNLREYVPSFKHAILGGTSPIGFRESRNIIGDYILTQEDVIGGARFDDGVARGAYPIDIHDPKGGRTQFTFIRNRGSFEIPYRSLIPDALNNVLVAGKTISATHEANGSARIMPCVISQGEAAGLAAATCIKHSVDVRDVDAKAMRQELDLYGERAITDSKITDTCIG